MENLPSWSAESTYCSEDFAEDPQAAELCSASARTLGILFNITNRRGVHIGLYNQIFRYSYSP